MIQFRDFRTPPIGLNICYDSTKIEEVNCTKFLGLMVDRHCDWKTHIEYVCDKLEKFVYAIKQLRLTVSNEAALSAYHGYVSSVLSYGLLLWGNSVEVGKAFRVQKKCVRAICGAWSLDSCKPLFHKFHILPLVCMYIRELCVFVKQHPQYFTINSSLISRSAMPRNKFKLHLPLCKLDIYKRNVFINAIRVYNKLPNTFKDLPFVIFKRKLTEWLATKCFYRLDEYMNYKEM